MMQPSQDLGDGLLLRRAGPADIGALVAFNGDVLRHQDAAEPDEWTAAWARDLLEHRHPSCSVTDFTVVEDTRRHVIVSSACLISQTWSFGGVPFKVGQPELVGTHPDYRARGLVRAQFDVLHQWSAHRGQQVLAIDGIPWFYRQFSYEMALALRGGRSVDSTRLDTASAAPRLTCRLRPATEKDLPFIAALADVGARRYLVTCCRDQDSWAYELCGRSAMNMYRPELRIVEADNATPLGFLAHLPRLVGSALWLVAWELRPEVRWHTVAPSVLRSLRTAGDDYGAQDGSGRCARIGFWFDTHHPLYAAIDDLRPDAEPPYAWYLRVPNLADFISHVAPVIEQRLASSTLAGFSGELPISFYQNGLRLTFERGRLSPVAPWRQSLQLAGVERGQVTAAARAGASFPGLTFLQLLFGYRSVDELEHAFPDCLVRTDQARALLSGLFPKQPSCVWAVL